MLDRHMNRMTVCFRTVLHDLGGSGNKPEVFSRADGCLRPKSGFSFWKERHINPAVRL